MTAYAFFDVDETLIHPKSMFDFLRFWYERRQQPDEYARQMYLIQQQVCSGADRAQVNRFYYRQFAGLPFVELMVAGLDWFNERLASGKLFKPGIVERLGQLRQQGIEPVLVSGSMLPVLMPIARKLGAQGVLCAEQESHAGLLTGELTASAIGSAKRERLQAFLAERGADARQCHAFGDHISDLPMLEAVAYPTAVDPCPELATIARQRGWPILITHTDT
ncbi:HAD family hydrolase [Parachitinimonas caeni]|uniref:HAD-IB family hydrolase n=1 Tax=Parachitinimonas caeni TaxID=3031301 RepID=A0ABT7E5P2_9NEIS|nr:HAD-IB family hydrolase [Parachitinimonas caeni]MDK2126683.1 HAD-IB family hydrolase [Parachitinimonas caeni]